MKNLKKIIVTVLVLAALVTTVVVTALAADGDEVSYTGTVAEAREMLDNLDSIGTASERSEKLKLVFEYFKNSPIDPTEEGYEELMLDYNAATLKVGQEFLGLIKTMTVTEEKAELLKSVYSHLTEAPINEEYSSYDEEAYEEWVMLHKNYSIETLDVSLVYLEDVKAAETEAQSVRIAKINALASYIYKAPVFTEVGGEEIEIRGFMEFIGQYNEYALAIVNELLGEAETAVELKAVYKQYEAATPNNNYATEDFYSRYEKFTEDFDKKTFGLARELLAEVDVDAENYTLATDELSKVYAHLKDIPPFNKSDAAKEWYAELNREINKCAYDLALRYYAEIESLIGNSDDDSSKAEFSKAVSDFMDFLKDCPALIYRLPEAATEFNGSLEEATELYLAVVLEGEKALESYALLYTYLSQNAVDPSLKGADEFYDSYELLKVEISNYVIELIQELDSAPTVEGGNEIDEVIFLEQFEELKEISEFLNATPVSSDAINEYNRALGGFLATAKEMWFPTLNYKAPAASLYNGDLNAALELLGAVDLKADNALEAYAALYEYLKNTPVDPAATGAAEMYQKYEDLTLSVSKLIVGSVNALASDPAYISIFNKDCPAVTYTIPAVAALNGTVEDATALLNAVNALMDAGNAELSAIFEAYTLLYNYNYESAVKPELEGASEYYTAYEALTDKVSKLVVNTLKALDSAPLLADGTAIDTDALKANAETLGVVASFLKVTPVTEEAVDKYNTALDAFRASINATYGNEYNEERFNGDLEKLIAIASYLKATPVSAQAVEAYNAAAEGFIAGVQAINCPVLAYKPLVSPNLNGELDEAEALLEAANSHADKVLDAYAILYKYMSENAIDPSHDGTEAFYDKYEELTLKISDYIITIISKLNSNPVSFDKKCPAVVYTLIESLTYRGDLEKANELLTEVRYQLGDNNIDLEKVIAAYNELFNYLRVNGIDPSLEGADTFYVNYNNVTAKVSELLLDAIASLDSYDELELYASFIENTRISREVVEAYNASLADFRELFADSEIDSEAFEKELEAVRSISAFLVNTPVSLDAVNAHNEVLHGFTVTLKGNFDRIYVKFSGFKAELDAYLKVAAIDSSYLPEDVDYESFKALVDSLSNYDVIKDVTDNIYTSELDNNSVKITSVDEYRGEFAKALNNLIAAALLEYKPLGTPESYFGVLSEAQAILARYEQESDPAVKAEIFAEAYQYIKNNPLNPKLDGYDLFFSDYEKAGNEVYRYLLDNIEGAEENDKNAAIAAMRDYLVVTPISEAAINAYNMKYLFTYRDALQAELEKYSAATEKLHDFIENSGNDEVISEIEGLEEILDNYESLEIVALVQLYNMLELNDDPTSDNISVIDRGNTIKLINGYARNYPISETTLGYETIMAELNAVVSSYEKALENAKTTLDYDAPLDEYSNKVFIDYNWDDGKNPLSFANANVGGSGNLGTTGTHNEILDDEARGGKYLTYIYADENSPSSGGRIGNERNVANLVFEFDLSGDDGVKSFSFRRLDQPPEKAATTSGFTVRTEMFCITDNKFYISDDGKQRAEAWQDKEVITPGEWTHFILVYNYEDVTLTAYIDYEYVDTWSVKYTERPDAILQRYLFKSNERNTSFNLDNLTIYEGTSFRIKDKFEKMNAAEKFCYFVDYMRDDTRAFTSRFYAYQQATMLLEQVKKDETLAEYVEKYNTFDEDAAIIKPAQAANLEILKGYAAELDAFRGVVTSSNSAAVQAVVDKIENFMIDNASYLDQASSEYNAIKASISQYSLLIERSETILSFVNALKRFDRAYTLAGMNKHYETATQYYELGEFYEEDLRLAVMSDPAVAEFEYSLNGSLLPEDEAYIDIFEYYAGCVSVMEAQKLVENSGRIIDCVGFIINMEDYEGTEEFWEANFDYIDSYMTIIRDIVREGAYDSNYAGVVEAIDKFREIDVYFYEILQNEHIAVLKEQLDKYPLTSSYIEKLGIFTFVNNYVAANDIDMSNPVLAALVLKNISYEAELAIYKDEYDLILNENTLNFINTVEKMKTYVGYSELQAIYEEALGYYYEMNLTDKAKLSVEVFEAYSQKLEDIRNSSAIFVGYVKTLESAKSDSALYKALVNCKAYVDKVSEDIDGVKAALKTYETKLAEYNAMAEAVNSGISEVNSIVCSVRANNIADAVISVINKIFNR